MEILGQDYKLGYESTMGILGEAVGMLPISKVPLSVARRGEFHQITDAWPVLDAYYSSWEKNFDTISGNDWCKRNNWLPVLCVTLYGIGIWVGPWLMKGRKPFDLRWTLATWNLSLSVFSFCGMVRTWPHVVYNLNAFSFEETLCRPAVSMYGQGATGLWVQLFIFSKMPELIDTVFIVLRKKELIFLHWYHHITVLLFCWHSYTTESPSGIYFTAMNYAVHAIMYAYYCGVALKIVPKWFPAGIITIAQISQMVVGVVLTLLSVKLYNYRMDCSVKLENLVAGGLMYFSYFVLFVHFAIQRYFLNPPHKKKLSPPLASTSTPEPSKKAVLTPPGRATSRAATPPPSSRRPESAKDK
jgi:hypothetical protein